MSDELERGRLAKEVLDNPIFKEALAKLQTEIVTKWQGERDEKSREWLWTLSQASKRLTSVLTEVMQTGQMREHQIELQRTRAEKVGQTLRRTFGR